MSLPEQEHYSYVDAAKKLGISIDEIAHYIGSQGLRAAVDISTDKVKGVLHRDSLSPTNQSLLDSQDMYLLITRWEPIANISAGFDIPDYVYINPSNKATCYTNEPPHEFKCFVFEMFDGQPIVCIGEGGYPEHIYLGSRDERGLFSDGVITGVELSRVLDDLSLSRVTSQSGEPKLGHFKVLRTNPVLESICHYGNMYISEHQENPTPDILLSYMLEKAIEDKYRPVSKDDKRSKSIQIGGTWLSERDYEKRYKTAFNSG